jgi:hypothetical protein
MPEVTDPALLAQLGQSVTVSDGRKGLSSAEAKSVEAGAGQSMMASDVLRGLGQVEGFNRRVPTGRLSASALDLGQYLPRGWQPRNVPDYQQMVSTSRGLLMPLAELQSGKALGASQINSERELDYWQSTIPGPRDEPAAVSGNVNRLGALAMRRIAQDNFNRVWRAKLGSLSALNPEGKTAQQVFEESLQTPRMAVLNKPLTQYIDEGAARRAAKGGAAKSRLRFNPATGELE